MLGAFLLILPFNTGFQNATKLEEAVYFIAFTAAVLASILSLAPISQHRIRWREGDKEALLESAYGLTIAASVALFVSMAASVFLVGQHLYAETVAGLVTVAMSAAIGWWWFAQPLLRRTRDRRNRR